ncbi:MAG: hypothetical protein AAFX05_05890 [Planctomycetota bacterium]
MTEQHLTSLVPKVEALRAGMLEYRESYLQDGEPEPYSIQQVDACARTLLDYIEAIRHAVDRSEALRHVQKSVLTLNDLNERCDHSLIETMQREDIANIIISAGEIRGFYAEDEDVTGEWREW